MRLFSKVKNKFGLTMVEVLLVVSIVSVLNLALYSAFSNGLKVWERSQRYVIEEDIAIFFDRVGRELRNSFQYSRIPFYGSEHRMALPTFVQTLQDTKISGGEKRYIQQMGVVDYRFGVNDKKLRRIQRNYSQSMQFSTAGSGREIASQLSDVKFKYFFLDQNRKLVPASTVNQIPPVVRIEVKYQDARNMERTLSKTVVVPAGFIGEDDE